MGEFVIKPHATQNPRRYDDTFLWKDLLDGLDVYIMLNHRLSLWCWLQCENVLKGQHSLVFIDQHCDMSFWRCGEKALIRNIKYLNNLVKLEEYNGILRENEDSANNKKTPCIHCGNFMTLATNTELFSRYYMYISRIESCERYLKEDGLNLNSYIFYNKIEDLKKNLLLNIKEAENKCIIDIDLDFFDKIENKTERIKTLEYICVTIKEYKKSISCVTIAITDIPSDDVWGERQKQLEVIKNILGLNMSIPLLTAEEIKIIKNN